MTIPLFTLHYVRVKTSIWFIGDGKKTVVSLDLDLYSRELMLCQCNSEMRERFVPWLGELDIVFAHIRSIGILLLASVNVLESDREFSIF